MQMNVQLHHAVADITGATGMRIIRAIVAGNHVPEQLAAYRDVRCHASEATIREALTGNYRPENVFALRQALELYDFHQTKIAECDAEIEAVLHGLSEQRAAPEPPLPSARHLKKSPNEQLFDADAVSELFRVSHNVAESSPQSGGRLAIRLTRSSETRLPSTSRTALGVSPPRCTEAKQGRETARPSARRPAGTSSSMKRIATGSLMVPGLLHVVAGLLRAGRSFLEKPYTLTNSVDRMWRRARRQWTETNAAPRCQTGKSLVDESRRDDRFIASLCAESARDPALRITRPAATGRLHTGDCRAPAD